MERRRKPEFVPASAILTGDWHLREDTPPCFTGDFQEEQWNAVQEVRELQQKHGCPVLHSGDLFNHWKPSPWLLSMAMRNLPDEFHTIYGNHDLPQHNLELADKCGINVLKEAEKLQIWNGSHWGQEPMVKSVMPILENRFVLVWHVMTYQGKQPWPGCVDPHAAGLLRKHSTYDLIVTGHNHKTFVEEHEGRLLVNPGSLTRQTADQVNHKPCVFLWYAETNTVVPHYLPIMEGAISREHIEEREGRDARIEAFISKLDGEWEVSLSFATNLETFLQTNTVRQSVRDIIYKVIE